MTDKKTVVVLCGGMSPEHEVSLQSAKNVIDALDSTLYHVRVVGIHRDGRWLEYTPESFLDAPEDMSKIALQEDGQPIDLFDENWLSAIDVFLPIVHGPYCEDGRIQGLLDSLKKPYIGPGVMASALCMDKEMTKRILRDANIPCADFIVVRKNDLNDSLVTRVQQEIGFPCFVKPANMGSAVGVYRVEAPELLRQRLESALIYDHKALIETAVNGRELECAVLGNEAPKASLIGELIHQQGYYSYEAKYLDDQATTLEIPAKLTESEIASIQACALEAFRLLGCEGMARIDFFMCEDGEILLNEVNTIPGFTKISMYPKLWEVSGLSYNKLLDELISLALARFARDEQLEIGINID